MKEIVNTTDKFGIIVGLQVLRIDTKAWLGMINGRQFLEVSSIKSTRGLLKKMVKFHPEPPAPSDDWLNYGRYYTGMGDPVGLTDASGSMGYTGHGHYAGTSGDLSRVTEVRRRFSSEEVDLNRFYIPPYRPFRAHRLHEDNLPCPEGLRCDSTQGQCVPAENLNEIVQSPRRDSWWNRLTNF